MSGPKVVIAMYGDSTTYGLTFETGTYTQSPGNEPKSLQWALQQKYGANVTVENHGVSGSTCPQWLQGSTGAINIERTWAQEMAQSTAQIVTMNCAINDAYLPAETSEVFQYLYGQFAQIARQYGKTFVIQTPNPIANPIFNQILGQRVQDEAYVAQVQQVAIIDQWGNIQSNVINWASYLPDGTHPNDALYEYKAQYSAGMLQGVVAFYLAH